MCGKPTLRATTISTSSSTVTASASAPAPTADGYVITQVTETKEDAKTLYVIAYQDAEKGRYQLAFYYEPSNGGRIIFKNQEQLAWTRKAPVS
ncbi:MAG: hypothetical protein U0231_09045 [Nitrospiraceae bacterium]